MCLFSRDFALYRTEYADENKITTSASKCDIPLNFILLKQLKEEYSVAVHLKLPALQIPYLLLVGVKAELV